MIMVEQVLKYAINALNDKTLEESIRNKVWEGAKKHIPPVLLDYLRHDNVPYGYELEAAWDDYIQVYSYNWAIAEMNEIVKEAKNKLVVANG